MLSDVLLSAKGLTKEFSNSMRPMATFWKAVAGKKAHGDGAFKVLKGIDLDVRKGETVGILGRNGAGKTTLLGVLGGVLDPSSGSVLRNGKISTLLGLTAGFNVNFSGRENAILFCSMQGFSRQEANSRIADIERFADLGRYFDMPLRTYSSGMQARLAFSCAVHVDTDLIIIDETLAVGDSNFRMKCYEKIRSMRSSGQTFLLVSHNQNLIANFCSRGIVLEGGLKVFDGDAFGAIEEYKRVRTESMANAGFESRLGEVGEASNSLGEVISLLDISFHEDAGGEFFLVKGRVVSKKDVEAVSVNFGLRNELGIVVCAFDGVKAGAIFRDIKKGQGKSVTMRFANRLLPGRYYLSFVINELVGDVVRPAGLYQNALSFEVKGGDVMTGIADLSMQVVGF